MKNDFREFYDEDYILHTAVEGANDEYISHSLRSTVHKYLSKFRNKFGKWIYVYPDDTKHRSEGYEQVQREAREGLAKYNKRHQDPAIRYEQIQRNARAQGEAARKKHTAARSSLDAAYAFRSNNGKGDGMSAYSIVMNNQERLAKRKRKADATDYANRQRKAARSAASKAQKAQIYGDYAAKQKKAVKSAASKAQKAQIYEHYDQMQKNKALGAAYRSARKQAHYDYKKKQAFYETDPAYGRNKKYKKYGTFPKWKMKK